MSGSGPYVFLVTFDKTVAMVEMASAHGLRVNPLYRYLCDIIFPSPSLRCPQLLGPAHSSSGSGDNAEDDPPVCCRIYLKKQFLYSGQPLHSQAWSPPRPKPASSPLAAHGAPSCQPWWYCDRLRTQPEPRPLQAADGRPGLTSRPHCQEASATACRTR